MMNRDSNKNNDNDTDKLRCNFLFGKGIYFISCKINTFFWLDIAPL